MSSLNYKSFLVGSAAAALFVGCGGSGDLGSNAISADCNQLFRCAGEDNDTAYDRLYYGTESACVRSEAGYDIAEDYRAYIDGGTVALDQSAADRCIAGISSTCTYTTELREACNAIFVGQVADGGGCVDDVQCVSGACSSFGFDECGSCIAVTPNGAPCDFSDVCADGPNGEQGYCNGVVCFLEERTDPLTGDATLGMDCDYEQQCAAGLFCLSGTCARWREAGDACDPDADSCTRGTFCLESEENPGEGTCIRVRIESGPGEDCGITDTEVVACDLNAGLYCNDEPTGVCALFSANGELGEYCEFTAECLAGLTCQSGYCLGEPVIDGAVCRWDVECQSGNCQRADVPPFESTCQPALVCP